ncbi:MAG: hypothetical protein JWQ27_919 [Ferruginibacter sp.]|nr:hypothetical protein [Ferruginibacter sp.]
MAAFLFEFEDQSWFPAALRNSMTDYLRYLFNTLNLYQPVTTLLADALRESGAERIVDLGAGGGGTIAQVQQNLTIENGKTWPVLLTDIYPNVGAYTLLKAQSGNMIDFIAKPVNAANVPAHLVGLRTMFSAFHHLDKKQARAVLQDAINAGQPIAVFDGGDRNVFVMIAIVIFHPILLFLFTPFFKPFRFSRILFTYIIPLIPFCTIWDGLISIMRLYTSAELLSLGEATNGNYTWKAGRIRNRFGLGINYLVGQRSSLLSSTQV